MGIPRPVAAAMGSHKNILVMGTKRKVDVIIVLMAVITSGSIQVNADVLPSTSNLAPDNEVIEEEPNGIIDFSSAIAQPDGSMCITKTKYVEKMEKTPVKECWHQNVTACHETYVTEFRPNQEQVCEEHFWKACKITFKEQAYNYTLESCMKPLIKKCEEPSYGKPSYGPPKEPKMVCKTWFESVCNTTYALSKGAAPDANLKPQTWCQKEPRKICAPDYCEVVEGPEECHDKTLTSTIVKPEEVCDLQPSTHCRLVTNLVPHLESQTVCKEIPKEVCHLRLAQPKYVKKPVTLRWCTKPKKAPAKPSYLPPPPSYPQPPVYEPRVAKPGSPLPTSSPVYFKPADNSNSGGRFVRQNGFKPIESRQNSYRY